MIIVWYADFDGDRKDLANVNRIFKEITDNLGGTVDGPYYPQTESLMYIFKVKSFNWLNESGRILLKRLHEEGIKMTPVRYEIAVTPEEFWGE